MKCQTQGAFVCVKDVKVSTCPWQGVFNLPGLSLLTLGQKFYFELKILETDAKNIICNKNLGSGQKFESYW